MSRMLIDGDIIAYRAASATQGKHYIFMGNKYESIKEMKIIYGDVFKRDAVEEVYNPEPVGCAYSIIENTMSHFPFSEVYIGGRANFRYEVATIKDYKGNRTTTKKPPHLSDCKQYLVDEYDAILPQGSWETDDEIALSMSPGDTLVTIDKDFMQLPEITLVDTISRKAIETTPTSGLISLYSQVLTGDVADNIPGLYMVGSKSKAVKALSSFTKEVDMFALVLGEYKKRFHKYAEQFMCENLKLLYLLRRKHLGWVDWLGANEFYEELYKYTEVVSK